MKVISIVGPTGVGKTRLSIKVAKHFNTEIISCDSVQIYKGLDTGSAKVTVEEAQGIKHHLIDYLEPDASFSVSDFQSIFRRKMEMLHINHKLPLLVGGTGLYLKAVLADYNFESDGRSEETKKEYEHLSNEELHHLLKEIDPISYEKIHSNNRKRVLRAIEYYDLNEEPISSQTSGNNFLYDTLIIGLNLDRETLYERINKRVDIMVEDGLIEEVKSLYDSGIRSQSVQAIGYKELYEHFDGNITLEEAIELIKRNSRRYAKKQFTWFKNQMNVKWVDVDLENFTNTENEAIKIIDQFLGN